MLPSLHGSRAYDALKEADDRLHDLCSRWTVKKAKDVVSEGVAAKGQRLAPPKATLASASALVSAGAISGESPPGGGTNATNRSSVAGDAPGCECCGRNAGGEGSKAGGVAGVGGAASVGTVCPMSSGVDHTSGYGTRSMVPAPPAGPAGSLPSAASSVAPEPLSLKVRRTCFPPGEDVFLEGRRWLAVRMGIGTFVSESQELCSFSLEVQIFRLRMIEGLCLSRRTKEVDAKFRFMMEGGCILGT